MIEYARLETRRFTFNIAFSGKFSYLMGDSGCGRTLLSDALLRHDRSGLGTISGPKKIYGGKDGAAFNHYNEDNCVLVIGDDIDPLDLLEYMDYIQASSNQFIYISREPVKEFPFTEDNVFTMVGGPKEFTMVPYRLSAG